MQAVTCFLVLVVCLAGGSSRPLQPLQDHLGNSLVADPNPTESFVGKIYLSREQEMRTNVATMTSTQVTNLSTTTDVIIPWPGDEFLFMMVQPSAPTSTDHGNQTESQVEDEVSCTSFTRSKLCSSLVIGAVTFHIYFNWLIWNMDHHPQIELPY